MNENNESGERGAFDDYLQQQLQEHLELRREFVRSHDLQIEIVELVAAGGVTRVSARICGRLNERTVEHKAKATRSEVQAGSGSAAGAVARVVSVAVKSVASLAFDSFSDESRLTQCVAEVTSQLLLHVDRCLEVPFTPLETRWRRFRLVRQTLAVVSVLSVYGFFNWLIAGKEDVSWASILALATFAGVVVGGLVYAIAFAIAILAMPAEFFLTELEGRRAVARCGVNSAGAVKLVAVGFLLTVVAVGVWYCRLLCSGPADE
ncbi:hypothetical protein [Lacipirellula parvula]|uniref:Uncharacterized protein n=1 Tax=Lacipirellula parvula TaxID=2650471 RepID=A0A5K7XBZ6_9BACT|nr:hypothetical protein [Lacipirellula parvula]BBO33547.1 hypothetical protein PLANPX_3159 [Lacipirellula parvula]